jgi:heat shock protein HspQ
MDKTNAQFAIGQIIHHKLFGYRGVVADVDATYLPPEEWNDQTTMSKATIETPWYRILVDGTAHMTYVEEKNLELDSNLAPIFHPDLTYFFSDYQDGKYISRQRIN